MRGRGLSAREHIGLGELEVYHPLCRTKILITNVFIGPGRLSFEGICASCDCYVTVMLDLYGLGKELRRDEPAPAPSA